MRHSTPFLTFFLLLSPAALACNEINGANNSLQSRLQLQEQIQDRLDDQLKADEGKCLALQSKISSHTAKIAGAQSCIALRESAAFNRELKEQSHDCAEKAEGMRFAMQFTRDSEFTPFRTSIDLIVQQDQGDSFLKRHCGGQLQDTASVLERTGELMARSAKGIAKAVSDTETYARLEAQVAEFEQITQGGYDRCVAKGEILTPQPKAAGAPAPAAVPVPQGQNPKPASDITGTEQEKAKKQRELEILGF